MKPLRVVVPTWNVREHLVACLESLRAVEDPPLDVIVVDDGGTDGSDELVAREFPEVRLLHFPENRGFAAACNAGLEGLESEYALLLNADTEVRPDAIARLAAFLDSHPEHAGAAPRLLFPDGRTQRACMAFPRAWTPLWFGTPLERWRPESRELRRYFLRDFDHEEERDVEQPPAACLLLRRSALESLRALDGHVLDERLSLYFNDVDLSQRLAAAGWRTRYLPEARVVHHVGQSTSLRPDRLLQWHLDRLFHARKHQGRAAALLVKVCAAWSFLDFALGQLARGLRGSPKAPVAPQLRSLGVLLVR